MSTKQAPQLDDLAAATLSGDRRALARTLTIVENSRADAPALLAALYPHSGRAHLIGVTGPPGSGKSTLVNALARRLRESGETLAVLAVDPSSPFTGGAILGDRIRMRDLSGDPGVFIRSMATRGSPGGLAQAAADLVDVLDAAGFDRILVETVGAGQSEVDIVATADTTVVVEAPGLGDDVQAIKAGILEIADVLVLNKGDQPSADSALRTLRAMLALGGAPPRVDKASPQWEIPLIRTVATQADGVAELLAALDDHREYLRESRMLLQRTIARARSRLEKMLQAALFRQHIMDTKSVQFDKLVEAVAARQLDAHTALAQLLALKPYQ